MERCCGTCKWFEPIEDKPDRGDCDWQYHHQLPVAILYSQSYMRPREGVACPCWEMKP